MQRFYYDDLSWKPEIGKTGKPVYKEIISALRRDIKEGALKPGDRLPPQRELADFLGINLSTVTRAFKICEQKGLIYATVGKGTFVSADIEAGEAGETADGAAAPHLVDLGMIYPLYNRDEEIIEAMRHVALSDEIEQCLSYDAPQKRRADGQTGAAWIEKMNYRVQPEHVFAVAGVQNALAIALTSLFSAGDKIAVDSYTYTGFKNLAYMLGIRLVPVEADAQGMDPDALRKICTADKIRGVYLMPECQNPTATTMPRKRRMLLAEVIRERGLIHMEDDTYAFLKNTGLEPVSAFVPEQSVYISGTSKALSAGLRVAFLSSAQQYCAKVLLAVHNINLMTAPFNTEVVSYLVRTGIADRIIRRKQEEAEARNALANDVLAGFDLRGNKRDYFRWLKLPAPWTGRELEYRAKEKGVSVFCAEKFIVGSGQAEAAVRLSLSAAASRTDLQRGLMILRDILEERLDTSPFII